MSKHASMHIFFLHPVCNQTVMLAWKWLNANVTVACRLKKNVVLPWNVSFPIFPIPHLLGCWSSWIMNWWSDNLSLYLRTKTTADIIPAFKLHTLSLTSEKNGRPVNMVSASALQVQPWWWRGRGRWRYSCDITASRMPWRLSLNVCRVLFSTEYLVLSQYLYSE